jgi:endonuclease/exonuclease/phosphatase family metal-dependent hydrolase
MHKLTRRAEGIGKTLSHLAHRVSLRSCCASTVPHAAWFAAALFAVAVTLVCAGPAANDALEASARAPLKALTWNIEQPQGARLQGIIEFLVRQAPDVIALQEIYEGESATLRSELRARTGKPWDGRFFRGIMLLTHLPILERGELWMPYADRYGPGRPAVHMAISFSDSRVQLFNTHLACCGEVDQRQRQVNDLIGWMGRYPGPALVAGDFNAVPTDAEIHTAATPFGKGMAAAYEDVWRAAGGETHPSPRPTRRIDYWFRSRTAVPRAEVAEPPRVLDVCTGWSFTRAEAGQGGPTCLSDHRAVLATFRIEAAPPPNRVQQ